MSSDQTANLIYALLFLVLVGSSLIARRLPLGQRSEERRGGKEC